MQQHKPGGIPGINITLKALDYWLLDWYYLNLNFLGIKQSENPIPPSAKQNPSQPL
jgi:hypothetical protein